MLLPGVQLRILPVGEHHRPAYDLMPEAAAQPVNGAFQTLGFDAPRLIAQKIQLDRGVVLGQRRQLRPALR